MATPHIAGLAALLVQAKKTATVEELERAIYAACTLPPNMLHERGNRGVPDAVAAVTQLTGQAPVAVAAAARPRRAAARTQRGKARGESKRARTPTRHAAAAKKPKKAKRARR